MQVTQICFIYSLQNICSKSLNCQADKDSELLPTLSTQNTHRCVCYCSCASFFLRVEAILWKWAGQLRSTNVGGWSSLKGSPWPWGLPHICYCIFWFIFSTSPLGRWDRVQLCWGGIPAEIWHLLAATLSLSSNICVCSLHITPFVANILYFAKFYGCSEESDKSDLLPLPYLRCHMMVFWLGNINVIENNLVDKTTETCPLTQHVSHWSDAKHHGNWEWVVLNTQSHWFLNAVWSHIRSCDWPVGRRRASDWQVGEHICGLRNQRSCEGEGGKRGQRQAGGDQGLWGD